MVYPPYCDICKIGFSAESEGKAFNAANDFFETMVAFNKASEYGLHLIVLGPLPPKVSKINNLYRQKLIIKCVNNAAFRSLIGKTLKDVSARKEYKNVNMYAVVNPDNAD